MPSKCAVFYAVFFYNKDAYVLQTSADINKYDGKVISLTREGIVQFRNYFNKDLTLYFSCSSEVKNFYAATGRDINNLSIVDAKCGDSFTLAPLDMAAAAFIIPSGTATVTIYVRQKGLSPGMIAFLVLLALGAIGGGIAFYFYKKR